MTLTYSLTSHLTADTDALVRYTLHKLLFTEESTAFTQVFQNKSPIKKNI